MASKDERLDIVIQQCQAFELDAVRRILYGESTLSIDFIQMQALVRRIAESVFKIPIEVDIRLKGGK